jgi:hypothetical protein
MGRDEKLNPFARMNVPIIGQSPRTPEVWDQLGRALQPGDTVLLPQSHPQFEIEKIDPAQPTPGEPPGLLDVTVRCRLVLRAMPSTPVLEIVRTRTKQERDEAKAGMGVPS